MSFITSSRTIVVSAFVNGSCGILPKTIVMGFGGLGHCWFGGRWNATSEVGPEKLRKFFQPTSEVDPHIPFLRKNGTWGSGLFFKQSIFAKKMVREGQAGFLANAFASRLASEQPSANFCLFLAHGCPSFICDFVFEFHGRIPGDTVCLCVRCRKIV